MPIREHAFPLDPAGERYAVIVEPLARTRVPVVLTVAGVGADAEATPLRLTDAKLATGAALPVPTSDRSALSPCRPAARCGSR